MMRNCWRWYLVSIPATSSMWFLHVASRPSAGMAMAMTSLVMYVRSRSYSPSLKRLRSCDTALRILVLTFSRLAIKKRKYTNTSSKNNKKKMNNKKTKKKQRDQRKQPQKKLEKNELFMESPHDNEWIWRNQAGE